MNHRQLGVELFNEARGLVESREDDERMLHAAHASAYHWRMAPEHEPKNLARAEWLCSRVYAVLGRAEPALHHARRCLELTEAASENMEEFDLPFAHEALARAYGVAGDREEATRHEERARELADAMEDAEDRDLLLADLAS